MSVTVERIAIARASLSRLEVVMENGIPSSTLILVMLDARGNEMGSVVLPITEPRFRVAYNGVTGMGLGDEALFRLAREIRRRQCAQDCIALLRAAGA